MILLTLASLSPLGERRLARAGAFGDHTSFGKCAQARSQLSRCFGTFMSDKQEEKLVVLGPALPGLVAPLGACARPVLVVTLFEQEPVVGGMCATQTFGRDGE